MSDIIDLVRKKIIEEAKKHMKRGEGMSQAEYEGRVKAASQDREYTPPAVKKQTKKKKSYPTAAAAIRG